MTESDNDDAALPMILFLSMVILIVGLLSLFVWRFGV